MENQNSKTAMDHDMELERALLASQEDDAIVKEAVINAGVALGADSYKRPAESPNNGDNKRQRLTLRNQLKIAIKQDNADVDDEIYFHNLYGHIFDKQQQLNGDFNPTFYNSGHTQGLGWFCAYDEDNLSWLKTTLAEIKTSGTIKDFSVMLYTLIPLFRRVILSVPNFSNLEKNGADKILNMNLNTRLNRNLESNKTFATG